jgi:hypothetical protein
MHNFTLTRCIANASAPNIPNAAPFPVPQNGKDYHFKGTATINGFPSNYDFVYTNTESSQIYVIGHSGLTRYSFTPSDDNVKPYVAPVNIQ